MTHWKVKDSCITVPWPVILEEIGHTHRSMIPGKVHVILGLNEENQVINAIDDADDYMLAFDGSVFTITYEHWKQLPDEIKKGIDTDAYLVYYSNSQRFIKITKQQYHDMKEL